MVCVDEECKCAESATGKRQVKRFTKNVRKRARSARRLEEEGKLKFARSARISG
jgi:hypothetical protein